MSRVGRQNRLTRFLIMAVCLPVSATMRAVASSADAWSASCISNGLWTGAVAMVGTRDDVLYRRAWGWMDTEKRAPMPLDAVFDLASVTKAVGTATALAVCIDRGLIDPDADFNTYLPGYAGELKGTVSVRDLARHISGFSNDKPYDAEGEVTERILRFSPVRPAGARYVYSCGNYIFLGLIIENVVKMDLAEFCRKNVFDPLGMARTEWGPLQNPDPHRVVRQGITHTFGMASDPPARRARHPVGNAGLFSTAEDLSALSRMMLRRGESGGKRLLSAEAVQMLGTRPDSRSPVAFGWRVDVAYNPRALSDSTLSHTGWAGHSIWIDPASQRYVIILTNRTGDHEQAGKARTELADRILKSLK